MVVKDEQGERKFVEEICVCLVILLSVILFCYLFF